MEERKSTAGTVSLTSVDARMLAGAVLFAALTGIGAIIRIPLTPIPVTMQVFFVFLSGLVLGPFWGPVSQALYLLMGLCGAPFFAAPPHAGPAVLLGPTGGYLWGFVLASWLTGLTHRALSRRTGQGLMVRVAFFASCMGGLFALYLFGASWLGTWLSMHGKSAALAFQLGVKPFLAIDLAKAAAASVVALSLPARWLD